MKTKLIILGALMLIGINVNAQKILDDFEGNKSISFGLIKGSLDTLSKNPKSSGINNSQHCASYNRADGGKYGFIKMYPVRKLADVSPYATHEGNPPKITMKVYSSAPKGTMVEIQLGRKTDDNYPSGVHSQYQAYTTKQNEWEVLTFTFATVPEGSLVSAKEVDKITLLFAPNSNNKDVFFFDDLSGPELEPQNLTGNN